MRRSAYIARIRRAYKCVILHMTLHIYLNIHIYVLHMSKRCVPCMHNDVSIHDIQTNIESRHGRRNIKRGARNVFFRKF